MAHRFRFIGERRSDGQWVLTGEEAHHLVKVLRLEVGAEIEVMDGRGWEADGKVVSARASEVVVAASHERQTPATPAPFVFAIGALKPGSVDDILPGLTELGVDAVWVFQQQESAKTRLADKAVERWQRIVSQAVKQCKRPWVPELRTFASLAAMLAAAEKLPRAASFVLGAGAEESLAAGLTANWGATQPVIVVAGGEKGLSADEEAAVAAAGFRPSTLGPYVLRAVTAAVAAAAVVAAQRPRVP